MKHLFFVTHFNQSLRRFGQMSISVRHSLAVTGGWNKNGPRVNFYIVHQTFVPMMANGIGTLRGICRCPNIYYFFSFLNSLGKFPTRNFSAGKSFLDFQLPAEISVTEIYRNFGFRFTFSGNYNFRRKKFWRKIVNSTFNKDPLIFGENTDNTIQTFIVIMIICMNSLDMYLLFIHI